MPDSTPLADQIDPTTGMSPRQAAEKLLDDGGVRDDRVAELAARIVDDPLAAGLWMASGEIVAQSTLASWHNRRSASRQAAADALAEAVRKTVDSPRPIFEIGQLSAALSAYERAKAGETS